MTKTIEEAAWNFARKQWGKQVPHTIDKIADMLIDFGNEVMAMPLSSRLTDDEKEMVRKAYKAMSDYGKKVSSAPHAPTTPQGYGRSVSSARICLTKKRDKSIPGRSAKEWPVFSFRLLRLHSCNSPSESLSLQTKRLCNP